MAQHGLRPQLTLLRRLLIVAAAGPMMLAARPVSGQPAGGTTLGHQACTECHQSEFAAWKGSPHAMQSFQDLEHVKAADFAKAIGVTGDLKTSACATCHATEPQMTTANGVSCESCHGPAGPEDGGWFKIHSQLVEGQNVNPTMVDLLAKRGEESAEHRKMRHDACDAGGMNRSAEIYDIAKTCLSCHTVAVEQLKDAEKLVAAGHPTSENFEMVRYSQGSVRHNFLLDRKKNAESPTLWLAETGATPDNRKQLMYVTGQLVDLELSLRSLSKAGAGAYADGATARITKALRALARVESLPQVGQVLQLKIDDLIKQSGANAKPNLSAAADRVGRLTKAFVATHHTAEALKALEGVRFPRLVEGDAFQP